MQTVNGDFSDLHTYFSNKHLFFFCSCEVTGEYFGVVCTTCMCVFCCVAVCVSLFLNKNYFMESARASPVKLGTFTSYTFSVQISSLILRTIGKPITSIHSKQQSRHSKVSKTSISTSVHYLQFFFAKRAPWPFPRNVCVFFLILLVCLIIKGLVTVCHHVLRILKKLIILLCPLY